MIYEERAVEAQNENPRGVKVEAALGREPQDIFNQKKETFIVLCL